MYLQNFWRIDGSKLSNARDCIFLSYYVRNRRIWVTVKLKNKLSLAWNITNLQKICTVRCPSTLHLLLPTLWITITRYQNHETDTGVSQEASQVIHAYICNCVHVNPNNFITCATFCNHTTIKALTCTIIMFYSHIYQYHL